MGFRLIIRLLLLLLSVCGPTSVFGADVVFVGQVPFPQDFANLGSTFGNQKAGVYEAPRGGDLFIRYSDGSIRNLTRAAGFGNGGLQGAGSIAVRDPAVNWEGSKVLFSMVVGAPTERYQVRTYFWQLYEITGLGKNETPVIVKVPNQPTNYNNIMPTYGTDGRIIFSTDRPRRGESHLYPQRDEYESTATNTGLWSLDPTTGDLKLLDHSPSGAFHPIVDSFGRVLYTRWDHLQRDQQNLANNPYGAFNFISEAVDAAATNDRSEFFPEPRDENSRQSPFLNLHTMNLFLPWMIHEDGTEHETLNHIGRHELGEYFDRTFNDDPNLAEFIDETSGRTNTRAVGNVLQLRESPITPGRFFGIDAPEFYTHSAGQVIAINGSPTTSPEQMTVDYVTHRDTASTNATVNHSGLYRNPLPLTDGSVVVSHTAETQGDTNIGTGSAPRSRYAFRLKMLVQNGAVMQAGAPLTAGLPVNITWWSPDNLLSFSGNLWEIQPVELSPRIKPNTRHSTLPETEQLVLSEEGQDLDQLKQFLRERDLALIVVRNVTSRDSADKQQPYNLRVANGVADTRGTGGKVYDVSHLQIFQGDLVRGYGPNLGQGGRRVLATPLHDAPNPPSASAPVGGVTIAADGSVAALVPAQRALTWQLTAPDQSGVVRERFWLTFQPGEIRVCGSCHGVNALDQAGAVAPQNKPQALRDMIRYLKGLPPIPPSNPPAPTFKLSTSGRDLQSKRSNSKLTPKKPWSAIVSQQGGNGSVQTVDLQLQIEGRACAAPIRVLEFQAEGSKTVTGITPLVRRDTKLTFTIVTGATKVASRNMKLLSTQKKNIRRKLSAGEIRKLCAQFTKGVSRN